MPRARQTNPIPIFLAAIAALLIWPTTPATAAATPSGLTTLALVDQFTQCGYEIASPHTTASSMYVVVEDPGAAAVRNADYRIVMAIVYADGATAIAAHMKAHRLAEDRLGVRRAFNDNQGPQLLAGYGGSVWRANVALVESSSATLASMWTYDIQTDETRVARPELFDLGFVARTSEFAVDRDFVACLEDAPLANDPALPTSVVPVFMPGQPW